MAKKSPAAKKNTTKPLHKRSGKQARVTAKPPTPAERKGKTPKPVSKAEPIVDSGFRGSAVVAIGASAGGFEAITSLLENVQSNGMAFVLLQHTALNQETSLAELLGRSTTLPVLVGEDGMLLEPDHVYLIPSHGSFGLLGNKLVEQGAPLEQKHLSIDGFFRSLAEDVRSKSIGVILSGTGSDGTLGLAAIKEAGGITFAQNETAKYDGMPRSAINAGVVDYIMPPHQIADELGRLSRHPYLGIAGEVASNQIFKSNEDLNRIFLALRQSVGIDFSNYKDSTVHRRIYRRMLLLRISNLADYTRFLQERPEEIKALGNDLLINVTSFFRDPESFEALKRDIFPEIMKHHPPGSTIRIWTAGCSTGEEAYSIAISIAEFLGDRLGEYPIQIFATDASDDGITHGRRGYYLENISQDVSPERLRRFFRKNDGGYVVNKTIRDMCIFAKQNIVKDPPFSRLDLISCRNVLIYLGPAYQKLLMGTFHHALSPHGYLMLGSSESIGNSAELFFLTDRKNKIYRKKSARSLQVPHHSEWNATEIRPNIKADKQSQIRSLSDLQREADRIVLNRFGPAGVIVDDAMQILHFRGQIRPFLEPAAGAASLDLLRMLRDGLRREVRTAIARTQKSGKTVRKEHIPIERNGAVEDVAIEVSIIKGAESKEQFYLVLFEHQQPILPPANTSSKDRSAPSLELERKVKALERELLDAREYLQRNIEEQDAYTEELKSANEEIQSANEELQSTNEELETAKEELQSINEELTTLNDEQQLRNQELSQSNNDFSNLLSSIAFGIVMVGVDLRIRRYNPAAAQTFNIIPGDIGRPIGDLRPTLDIPELSTLIESVIQTLAPVERDVKDIRSGKMCHIVVRPYKTNDNKIDGAVIIVHN